MFRSFKAFLCWSVAAVSSGGAPSFQMEPQVVLPTMVRGAERAVVSRLQGNRFVAIHVIDPAWMEQVARVLERASFQKADPCFCITPGVHFYLGDRHLSLSVHHGDQLRCSSSAVCGDFFMGEESGRQLVQLLASAKSIIPGAKVEVPAARARSNARQDQSLESTGTVVAPVLTPSSRQP